MLNKNKHKKYMTIGDFSNNNMPKFSLLEKLEKNLVRSKLTTVSKALEKKNKKKMFLTNSNKPDEIGSARSVPSLKQTTREEEEIAEKVLRFNKEMKENFELYRERKEENDEFLKSYGRVKKMAEDEDLKKPTRSKGPEIVFSNLIRQYKQKGYKIPNLSVDKNLFKPSPLLLDELKLVSYYKSNGDINNSGQDKDLQFLVNLNLLMIDKTSNDDEKKLSNMERQMTLSKRLTIRGHKLTIKEETPLNTEEIEKELKINEEQKKKLRRTLRKFPYRKYDTSIKASNTPFSKKTSSSNISEFDSERISLKSCMPARKSKILFRESVTKFKLGYISPKDALTIANGTTNSTMGNNSNVNFFTDKTNTLETEPFYLNSLNDHKINFINLQKNNESPEKNPKTRLRGSNVFLKYAKINKMKTIMKQKLKARESQTENNSLQNSFINEPKFSSKTIPKFSQTTRSNMLVSPTKNKNEELELLYENVVKKFQKNTNHDSIYNDIDSYFKEHKKFDYKTIDREKTVQHLIKSVSDLKFKVGLKDIYSSYLGMTDKTANSRINFSSLVKIKQMDNKILNMNKVLIKALNREGYNNI